MATTARRPPRVTVNTDAYFAANWTRTPKGYGLWVFENAAGERREITEFYGTAVRSLPAGEWKVLP